jgi:hypothetical protein
MLYFRMGILDSAVVQSEHAMKRFGKDEEL